MTVPDMFARFKTNANAVAQASKAVSEYMRLLKRHPKHHGNVEACQRTEDLAAELGRDVEADKANPKLVAESLKALSSTSFERPKLREYKKALDACVRECREEANLYDFAKALGRDADADLADSVSVSHLLADIRSMSASIKSCHSEPWFSDRARWRALHKALRSFGWVSDR